jgi:vacuolar-type H+-ATPase subunit I/STV1
MKQAELKLGIKYAIIPAWDYSSADKKNPDRVTRKHVAKAELVSMDKYEYKVFRFDSPDNPNFQPAPQGSRSIGLLVKSDDWNNETTYWLARPQDIVAEYATLEARWSVEEAEIAKREAEEKAEREASEQRRRDLQLKEQRNLDSLNTSLQAILGDRARQVRSDINSRRTAEGEYVPVAEFVFTSRTLSILIEKVLEAKDLVG